MLVSEPFPPGKQFCIEEEVRRQAEREGEQSIIGLVTCDLANMFLAVIKAEAKSQHEEEGEPSSIARTIFGARDLLIFICYFSKGWW